MAYGHDDYAEHHHGYDDAPAAQNNNQYADLARQLEAPPVALTSPPRSPHGSDEGHHGNGGKLGRALSTSVYGSLSAQNPTPSHPTRSGTPVDVNPQQAYLAPGLETQRGGSKHNGHHAGYDDEEDAYGGM